ncbi:hypothetical protein JCM8547_001055 [Rhodosporidiobolus lusitaniae]
MPLKSYDIAVFGASGFTGQLVCRYLFSESRKEGFSFVPVGRDREKVEKKMKEVGVEVEEVLVAESGDEEALRGVVKRCKVVISLVGPYMKRGYPLVKVCAEEGVHYTDLTGETPFVFHSADRFSRAALDSKALILHACGFDSIPSDLCTFLAVQKLKSLGEGVQAGKVRSGFKAKGGVSGGTVGTLFDLLEAPKEDQKRTSHPYALSPVKGAHNPWPVSVASSTFRGQRTYGSLWIMGPFNSQIVRRSWGILESADPSSRLLSYGKNFEYNEYLTMKSPFRALLLSLTLFTGFAALVCLPPIRWLAKRYGPQSGDGPSKEDQEKGWFEVSTVAKSDDAKYEARAVMKGKGDPGYSATALMISSAALCLLKDHDRLPRLAQRGGHLTPATALGKVLVERLEKTGRFSFEVEGGEEGRKER